MFIEALSDSKIYYAKGKCGINFARGERVVIVSAESTLHSVEQLRPNKK